MTAGEEGETAGGKNAGIGAEVAETGVGTGTTRIEVIGVRGLPEIKEGDDILRKVTQFYCLKTLSALLKGFVKS